MAQLKLTADILSAALQGFEAQKNRIDARIAEIRQMLAGSSAPAALTDTGKASKAKGAPQFGGRWPWRNGLDTPSSSKSLSQRKLGPPSPRNASSVPPVERLSSPPLRSGGQWSKQQSKQRSWPPLRKSSARRPPPRKRR